MINISIIGAGQLGSRHLQALAQLKRPVSLHVVDPSAEALKTAEQRFQEVATSFDGNISFYGNIDSLPKSQELVIVATGSKIRRSVIEQILAHAQVKFLVLEKFLFTKLADYEAVGTLLQQKNVKTWVNCPRRMMPYYQQLQQQLEGPIHFFATGNEWGLGCNGIHLVDLFAFLTKHSNIHLFHQLIDKKVHASKRSGYVEFTGTITGYAGEHSLHLTSFEGTPSPLHIHLHTPTVRYSIQEGPLAKVWISRAANNWQWEEAEFSMPFQSQLSHVMVEEILQTGHSSLTEYEESARLHRHFLANLLQFQHALSNVSTTDEVLIT